MEDGKLIIEARQGTLDPDQASEPATKAEPRRRRGSGTADYTSASLTTQGKAAWTHGRIEVRAKLPSGRGTWPAIWMPRHQHPRGRMARLR